MKNKITMALVSLAAFGAVCATAQTPAPTPPDSPLSPDMQCGPMGPENARACAPMEGGRDRFGPGMRNDENKGGRFMEMLPDELKARMENVRGQRRELNLLWAKAVASRGDKSVADTRADFNRVNAAAIAKLSADEQTLREDIAAIRDGYAGEGREDVPMSRFGAVKDDSGPGPMDEMPGPPEGNLRKVIETEIVARIGSLKEPLTADSYSKIVREVFSSHRREFVESMRNRQGPGMGPMAPDLARMRDAMNHMRDASWGEKREFRSELRAAMKIQDQQAREAAVRQILDKYAVDSDESKDAPPAPEKTR